MYTGCSWSLLKALHFCGEAEFAAAFSQSGSSSVSFGCEDDSAESADLSAVVDLSAGADFHADPEESSPPEVHTS